MQTNFNNFAAALPSEIWVSNCTAQLYTAPIQFRSSTKLFRYTTVKSIKDVDPLMGTIKKNRPLYSNATIGTLAVGKWAVAFGTERRGLGEGCGPAQSPWLYQM